MTPKCKSILILILYSCKETKFLRVLERDNAMACLIFLGTKCCSKNTQSLI